MSSNFKSLTPWEKLLFFLSIYVIIELYVSTTMDYTEETAFWLNMVDTVICGLFLYDFFKGLKLAENKWDYVKKNWIHFISSIPFGGFLRIGRIAKVLRVLRLLRSGQVIYSVIQKNDAGSTFRNLVILNIMFIFFISVSFFHFERGVNPAIETFGDSFLWGLITTITFSYLRNIPPVTPEGQVLSIVLTIMRMVLFGTLISTITDFFLKPDSKEQEQKRKVLEQKQLETADRVENIERQLEELRELLREALGKKGPEANP